jgi:hypothetical protein
VNVLCEIETVAAVGGDDHVPVLNQFNKYALEIWGASQPPSVGLLLAFFGEHCIFLLLNADEPGALPD